MAYFFQGPLVLVAVSGCVSSGVEPPPQPSTIIPDSSAEDSNPDTDDSGHQDSGTETSTEAPRNVLLLLLDDVGTDKVGAYAEELADVGYTPDWRPATPIIDSIAGAGLRFTHAWATPTCSPTRAGIHTGQHPFRNGITAPVPPSPELPVEAVTLPEIIAATHRSALVGKWHLGTAGQEGDPDHLVDFDEVAATGTADSPVELLHTLNPVQHGWERFTGSLEAGLCTSGGDSDCNATYDDWTSVSADIADTRTVNDRDQQITRVWQEQDYATDEDVERTLAWVSDVGADPWLTLVAFRSSHTPLHDASTFGCITTDVEDLDLEDSRVKFLTMTECLDTRIGDLLEGLDALGELEDTLIIVVSDNGTLFTVGEGAFDQSDRGKGTAYESGVRVPLIVADGASWKALRDGVAFPTPAVVAEPGRTTDRPVLTLDLYATVAELVGADASAGTDAVSFLDLMRDRAAADPDRFLFTEYSREQGGLDIGLAAIRDRQGHKLVVTVSEDPSDSSRTCASYEHFDVVTDPLETIDLIDDQTHDATRAALLEGLEEFGAAGASWLLTGGC